MRITKVYTKFGDGGKTYLANGEVVPKTHPRVVAYGDVDELNSFIGLIRSELPEELKELDGILRDIQNDLFLIGGDLATPPDAPFRVRRMDGERVRWLEGTIDRYNGELPPLKEFILPAGHRVSALLHVARTVCRRAERTVISAMEGEEINPQVQIYLNRLSDLLFVLARWVNHRMGRSEEYANFK